MSVFDIIMPCFRGLVMSVDFSRIEGGNEGYNCSICLNEEKGQFVCHTGEGGDKHPIHEICAKRMLNSGESICALCRKLVDLSSLLTSEEIGEREDHQEAQRLANKLDQEVADALLAQEMNDAELASRLQNNPWYVIRGGDIRAHAAMARPPGRRAEINPCIAAAVFLGALIVASFAKGWFV